MTHTPGARTRASGVTLVESLVALLILSIGLLGVAGMQLRALQGAHAGYQRSMASLAAQDVQERLWAALAETYPDCPEVTAFHPWLASWQADWSKYLPALDAEPISSSAKCVYDVELRWDESRFGITGDALSFPVRLPGGRS